jgi:hypothetical protein
MTLDNWSNFFVANAGASAALTGLIFVGVSINLTKILSIVSLPERALISLILLFSILIRSLLFLVPDKKLNSIGLEILITGFITWLVVTVIDINIVRKKEKEYKRLYFLNFCLNQVALFPYFISGILIMNVGISRLDWLVLAFIFSYVKAMLDAWVLLVEINR